MKTVFITGIAGMIGYHTALELADAGYRVFGVDNFDDYYDVELKEDRARILKNHHKTNDGWPIVVYRDDLRTMNFYEYWDGYGTGRGPEKPDVVIHLACYGANPRHSMTCPEKYIDHGILATQKLIEACEDFGIDNVIYASSSCVMHGQSLPWNEQDRPDHQNNPYGWSKRTNECQFKCSNIKRNIGLRFFTVYGPYGRPDMALFTFTHNIINGKPIIAYNNGDMVRDFTYVDDIVRGEALLVKKILEDADEYSEIFNIGCGKPTQLMDFIAEIEKNVDKKAEVIMCPAHPADVPATWADTSKLEALGYSPDTTPIQVGVKKFVDWYKSYYR